MIITIPIICVIIAVIACIYASYSDLKYGIIQNKLTFSLIAVGIILNGIYAYTTSNIWHIIGCLTLTAVIFALGYLFWKIGAWAGGDVKLFTALAALIPFYPAIVSYQIFNVNFPIQATWWFPLTLIINSILSMLPFLLIFVFYIAVKNKRYILEILFSPVKDYKNNFVLTLVIISAVTITYTLTQQFNIQIILLSLILVYLLSLVISKTPNNVKAVLISVVTVYALITDLMITITGIVTIFISIIIINILIKLITSVSREALQDDYKIEELKEGMIPAYNTYENGDKIYIDDKSFFTRLSEAVKTGDISVINAPKGKLLVSSMAAGLTEKDIKLLAELKDKDRIVDKFRIKRGVPFAPSILIGLLISLFIGDLAFILEKILFNII